MTPSASAQTHASLRATVEEIVRTTPVFDIHTHLYDPAFGELLLWGIDDLLVYHYLVAETFRYLEQPFDSFWKLSKVQQADLIWDNLFVKHSPVSEACRGVLTTLQALGLEARKNDLATVRGWFAERRVEDYIGQCMELGGVRRICMTNSPFDDLERPIWERGFPRDARFVAGLRLDPLVLDWPASSVRLREWGYPVTNDLTPECVNGVRRFLEDWTRRIQPIYAMVSLPPDFSFPGPGASAQVLERAVLPHCRERGLPFAMMPGVQRAVNPALRLAGDGSGLTNLESLRNLCSGFPKNKFLVTVLARENQHELCVLARKFRNLHVFGCWWFMNVPALVDEVTRLRVELIGLSFTPQHSDARVLDQLIYKWRHARRVIGHVLADEYAALAETGWVASREEIERDVRGLFGGEFERFCESRL